MAKNTTTNKKDEKMGLKNKEINTLSIILKPGKIDNINKTLSGLLSLPEVKKKKVLFSHDDGKRIKQFFRIIPSNLEFVDLEKLLSETDMIITMGGDGILIGAGRYAPPTPPPIFGVNLGKLGFITEFSQIEFYEKLKHALQGKFSVNKINLFKVEVHRMNGPNNSDFFVNDVVVNKSDISRIFTLSVDANEEHIYDLSGDGLIISSPLGSTAYSLAAGGPIIHPEVNSLVLTPICPHSLTNRPLVISDKHVIKIKVLEKDKTVNLTLDGQQVFNISESDIVIVSKSDSRYMSLIKNSDRTYFGTLKEKLIHGKRQS